MENKLDDVLKQFKEQLFEKFKKNPPYSVDILIDIWFYNDRLCINIE